VTPNREEANFKSNERKLMSRDASSALEMKWKTFTLKASPSHTSNLFLILKSLKVSSKREWGGELNAQGGVCPVHK
jgi:hypothetical protein